MERQLPLAVPRPHRAAGVEGVGAPLPLAGTPGPVPRGHEDGAAVRVHGIGGDCLVLAQGHRRGDAPHGPPLGAPGQPELVLLVAGRPRQHLEGALLVAAPRVERVQPLAHGHDEHEPDRAERRREARADGQRRRLRVVDEHRSPVA